MRANAEENLCLITVYRGAAIRFQRGQRFDQLQPQHLASQNLEGLQNTHEPNQPTNQSLHVINIAQGLYPRRNSIKAPIPRALSVPPSAPFFCDSSLQLTSNLFSLRRSPPHKGFFPPLLCQRVNFPPTLSPHETQFFLRCYLFREQHFSHGLLPYCPVFPRLCYLIGSALPFYHLMP